MRMLTKRTKMAAAVLAAAFGAPSAVFAASVNVDLDTGTAGVQATRDVTPPASFGATINFVGDGAVTNVSGRLNYDTTRLDATATSASGATCAVNDVTGIIAFTTTSGSGSALASQTICNVTFTVPGTVTPPQSIALTFSNLTFADTTGADTSPGGTINAVAAPVTQGPTLTFTPPAPGPVALSPGGTGSIAVGTTGGTAGTTTSLVCTPSAGFTSSVTGSPFSPGGSGTVNLGCTPTPGGPVQNGTVSCDPTQSAGTDQAAQVFNVSCPAAPANQAPTITFAPPAPGPLTISQSGAGTIGLTASTGTAGTSTTVACTSTNGTATVTGSPFSSAGGTGSVAVQCNPAVGAAGTAFTVTCDPTQSAGTDQAPQVFNATCPAITPQPEFDAVLSVGLTGAPGTTATGSTTIRNLGNAPLTLTCTPPTGGFVVTGPPASIPAGGSGTLGVSCTTSGASGTTVNGSLVCTTNDTTGGEGTVTFAFSCTSQLLSVPALGNTAKGMLVALLAGLGLFGFAMRRRIV